jgi:PAS domain S-box-containing protein
MDGSFSTLREVDAMVVRAARFSQAPNWLAADLIESLLDEAPQLTFSVKDQSLHYVSANKAMLELFGVRSRCDVVGKSAADFFPEAARRRYEASDRLVMRTRRPIKNQLDLTTRLRGAPMWMLVGRWPVIAASREVVGVAVVARILNAPDRRHPIYERIADAVEHMKADFGSPFDIAELARRAGVSLSRLERDFIDIFGMPPRRYLMQIRLEVALELLLTDKSIVEVAYACGYADQSAFSRRFHSIVGVTPSEYRRDIACAPQ